MRDYRAADTIRLPFGTNAADGSAVAPSAASGKLYEDGSLTEITAGLTVTTSYDGVTGANMLVIDGTTAGLKPGKTYSAQISATIAGLTCVAWIGQFSVLAQGGDIVSRGLLDAGGAGAFTLPAGQRDRVKVGDAIRIVGGTGYGYRIIKTYNSTTGAGTVTAWDINPVATDPYEVVSLPIAEVLDSVDFADSFLTGAKIAPDAISAGKVSVDAVTEIQTGLATAAAQTAMQTDVTAIKGAVDTEVASILADTGNIKTRLPAALVGGKMDSSVDLSTVATAAGQTAMQGDVTTIKNAVDTEVAAILAAVDTEIANIQSRLPAALVGGKMDASVDLSAVATAASVAAVQADTGNIKTRLPAALVGGKMDSVATATIDNDAVAAAVFAHAVEAGLNFDGFCKLLISTALGLTTGIRDVNTVFKSADVGGGLVVGTKNRVTAVRDAEGNRLSVTVDVTP